MKAVVSGKDANGITEEVRWAGGGGFNVFELAPSLSDLRSKLSGESPHSDAPEATAPA